jgi:hypothetical protein
MAVKTNLTGASNMVLQEALSMYADEAYTTEKKLVDTGLTSSNPNIDPNTETYIGQVRWYKPLNPTVNVASISNSADGTLTSYSQDYMTYVKTVRTHGASKVNMAQVVTQEDGLAKIGRDFGETKAKDQHDAIMAVLKGVAISEVLNGCAAASGATGLGGQTFYNDPTNKAYGFYVDLAPAKVVVDASTTKQGAARAEGFLNAMGAAWKDYEPDYC